MRPRTQTLIIGFLIILLVCGHLIKPVTNYLMLPIGRILAFGGSAYVGLTVNPVIGMLIALVCLQAMNEFYIVEHFARPVKAERAGEGTVMDEVARNLSLKDEAELNAKLARAKPFERALITANINAMKPLVEADRARRKVLIEEQGVRGSEDILIGKGVEITDTPICECPVGYTQVVNSADCKNDEGKVAKASMCRCPVGYAYDTVAGVCNQNSVMTSPIPVTAPAPEGTETPTLEPEPRGPAASSIRPMQIELSAEDRLALLGKEPAGAE